MVIPCPGLHEDAGIKTRVLPVEERHWEFRNTIAFWAATFFLQGSVLFTVGSIAMYPKVLEGQPEFLYEAWVDYSFFIGACCFTLANYAVYFQVINSNDDDSVRKVSFFAKPSWNNWGQMGSLANFLGSLCYNLNTALFFDTRDHDSLWYKYNLVYVLSGGVGSILFALGSIAEGEHNGWRNKKALKKPEVQMAILNLVGSLLFLLAYIVDYNHYADNHEYILTWLVATPFTVGSIFFFVGSWISLYLWKQQNFGLGFAKHIIGRSHVVVDMKVSVRERN